MREKYARCEVRASCEFNPVNLTQISRFRSKSSFAALTPNRLAPNFPA
jgi:hypothetical protein